jgi:hypothetical protein
MTVRFFSPNAPTTIVSNEYFDSSEAECPLLNPRTVEQSLAPEFEINNINFDTIIRLLDPNNRLGSHSERVGKFEGDNLLKLYYVCDFILEDDNITHGLNDYARVGDTSGNIHYYGMSRDDIRYYLINLMNLAKYCIDNKFYIQFA